jgi:hypothetical protein
MVVNQLVTCALSVDEVSAKCRQFSCSNNEIEKSLISEPLFAF